MNLDELQSVRDRERQSDSLQQLRDSFYADAGELIQQLRDERDLAAERAEDPFDDPEVNRITDDINTAEQTVEAIYERRVGKLVKMASFAAADMPTEDEGLTAEERELFESMVASIEANRDRVFAVLDGDDPEAVDVSDVTATTDAGPARETDASPAAPSDSTESAPDPEGATGVGAAELMGGADDAPTPGESDRERSGAGAAADGDRPVPPQEPTADGAGTDPDRAPPESVAGEADDDPGAAIGRGGDGHESGSDAPAAAGDAPDAPQNPRSDGGATTEGSDSGVDRRTVRITQDVGEILGIDERAYDLAREDVVTLPAANAEPLVERDAAEPLDP